MAAESQEKQTQSNPTCSELARPELACGELVEPVEGVEPISNPSFEGLTQMIEIGLGEFLGLFLYPELVEGFAQRSEKIWLSAPQQYQISPDKNLVGFLGLRLSFIILYLPAL